MSKNKVLACILGLITCLVISVIVWYFTLIGRAQKLTDHYPVYSKQMNDYQLVAKKPAHWVSLKKISNSLKWAIVLSEDWAFYDHHGIDFNQLQKAIEESLDEGKLTRGASTITQQVVKNAFLSHDRTITRKIKEILIAQELETILSKDRILEHYLNLIELGKGIYGVKAGAKFYFDKEPHDINPKEAAFLAMLLPSPKRYSQSFTKKELTDFASTQITKILEKMKIAKVMSEEELEYYKSHPLSFEKGMQEDNILANDYLEEKLIMNDFEEDIFAKEPPADAILED
ncbi:MAG: hypothetical protein CME62_14315 [Halobacteriovoraceae bacterium]|nr:hypothetical protein [Halobacteriovoraceae bacterium]|tara:strand:- start:10365 stop:11225 length:861 start_codon:yes stop_codon:yes gene_type:complete